MARTTEQPDCVRRKPPSVEEVVRLLETEYGPRAWHRDGGPVSVLVQTILSQNTSDINSGRAFRSLRDTFPTWEAVAEAMPQHIARAIAQGGLANIKAERIKHVLQMVRLERGKICLDFLGDLPPAEARAWLRRLPGVGPKTASCVLLFALGKAALPVDTHVHRVGRRLGLLPQRISPEQAEEALERIVPERHIYQFHVHLIEHGRKVCRAQRPRCTECALGEACPSFMCF